MGFLANKKDLFFLTSMPGTIGTGIFYTNKDKFLNGQKLKLSDDEGLEIPNSEIPKSRDYRKKEESDRKLSETIGSLLKEPTKFEFKESGQESNNKSMTFKWYLPPTGSEWQREKSEAIEDNGKTWTITKWKKDNKCRWSISETDSEETTGTKEKKKNQKDEYLREISSDISKCTGDDKGDDKGVSESSIEKK